MSDYTTSDYAGAIETIPTPVNFFKDRYFKIQHFSDTEDIKFDKVSEDIDVMAPFVSPLVVAKTNKAKGHQVETFKPAYVKEKDNLTPKNNVTRLPGEKLNGSLSPAERKERKRIEILASQKKKIYARFEWMAAMATLHAKVTIDGDDYPAVVVDFGRDPSHEVIITDNNKKWDNVDADIHNQLEDHSADISKIVGTQSTDVVMSTDVWQVLRKNKAVIEDADLRRGVTNVPTLSPQAYSHISYKGSYGDFKLYVHSGNYRDVDGTVKPYVDNGYAHIIAPAGDDGKEGLHGIQAYGHIFDFDADEEMLDIFTKDWDIKEPSAEVILSQSSPLMIPGRPNATKKIKVM